MGKGLQRNIQFPTEVDRAGWGRVSALVSSLVFSTAASSALATEVVAIKTATMERERSLRIVITSCRVGKNGSGRSVEKVNILM